MLQHILAAQPKGAATRNAKMRRIWLALAGLATAGAIVLVALVNGLGSDDRFTTRGNGQVATSLPMVRIICLAPKEQLQAEQMRPSLWTNDSFSAHCRRADTLSFLFQPVAFGRYFAAVAFDADTGSLIWYFPTGNRLSEPVPSDLILTKAVIIGPEHQANHYQLYGFVSDHPVTRQEVRAALEQHLAGRPSDLPIIEGSLQLEEAAAP